MHNALAREYMSTHVHRIHEDNTIDETLQYIMTKHGSYVIVYSDNEIPIGIVTKKDIIKNIVLHKRRLSDKIHKTIMTKLTTVTPDTPIKDIIKLMMHTSYNHMPVEENGRIVGMVTEKELLEHSEVLHDYSERLARYQNIQSYIIIAFFIVLLLIFFFKIL